MVFNQLLKHSSCVAHVVQVLWFLNGIIYSTQIGLCANPSLYCTSCETETPIPFATVDNSKSLLINRKSIFANKCVGGTHSSLNTFCAMMNMPTPLSKNSYTEHTSVINDHCIKEAKASTDRARQEVRQLIVQ